MINLKIICIGKLNEDYLKQAQNEYLKRLKKYCNIEIIELNDQKLPTILSDANVQEIKAKECSEIIQKLDKLKNYSLFALDLKGKEYDSIQFANLIQQTATYTSSTIVYIIGGTLGLTDQIIKKSNKVICFSKLTFPHQLIRIFLLEQMFRAFKILNNESYHH